MVIEVPNTDCTVFLAKASRRKMTAMFDIFTTQPDGSLHFIESVSCATKAQEMARRLSCLFPGECFAYFERTEGIVPAPKLEGRITSSPSLGVSSLGFLV
jgi:hypothetical protein